MSADNGIYVLKTPVRAGEGNGFEYRIAEAQAIENAHDCDRAVRERYISSVFGSSWVLHSSRRAQHVARLLHRDLVASGGYTEYGVVVVKLNEPFPRSTRSYRFDGNA